jgi:hypothetical protein
VALVAARNCPYPDIMVAILQLRLAMIGDRQASFFRYQTSLASGRLAAMRAKF